MNALTIHGYPILTRRPAYGGYDVVLIFRGGEYEPFVTGLVGRDEQAPTSWYNGHYMNSLEDAVEDLHARLGNAANFYAQEG